MHIPLSAHSLFPFFPLFLLFPFFLLLFLLFPHKLVYISQCILTHVFQNPHFLIGVSFTGQAIFHHYYLQFLKELQSAIIFLINLDFSMMLI